MAIGVQLLHEDVSAPPAGEIVGVRARVEVHRAVEITRGVDVARAVHRDAEAPIIGCPAYGARPDEMALGIQLLHENIAVPRAREVVTVLARIEVHRFSEVARGVDIARAVHCDASSLVKSRPAHGGCPFQANVRPRPRGEQAES